jgi:hypothetical protein
MPAVARMSRSMSASLEPQLIGRAPELDLIERHLNRAAGHPLLMFGAEPGLGKTRLVADAAGYASSDGWCVLQGGCLRRSGQEPFAPLVGAFATFLGQRERAALHVDLQGCAWLVRFLPELADVIGDALPTLTVPAEQEHRLMFQAVRRLLDNQAARNAPKGRVLLVLDDLQWAGSVRSNCSPRCCDPPAPRDRLGSAAWLSSARTATTRFRRRTSSAWRSPIGHMRAWWSTARCRR